MPKVLTVVLVNQAPTLEALIHLNSWMPFEYRTVHIPLTPEQEAMIRPRFVGHWGQADQFEAIGQVWLEDAEQAEESTP